MFYLINFLRKDKREELRNECVAQDEASTEQPSTTATTVVLKIDKAWNSGFFEDTHYKQLCADFPAVAIRMKRELGEVEISGPAEKTEVARSAISSAVEVVKKRVVANEGLCANFSELMGKRIGPGLDVRVTFAEDKDGKAIGVCLKGARGEVRLVKGLVKALLKEKSGQC